MANQRFLSNGTVGTGPRSDASWRDQRRNKLVNIHSALLLDYHHRQPPNSVNMSATSVKTRHYHALASRLRQLQTNLHDSEVQFDQLAHRLESMQKLGTYHAAQ